MVSERILKCREYVGEYRTSNILMVNRPEEQPSLLQILLVKLQTEQFSSIAEFFSVNDLEIAQDLGFESVESIPDDQWPNFEGEWH